MKLLSRLHRGPKRSEKHNEQHITSNNSHTGNSHHGNSPFRRKKRDSKPRISLAPPSHARYEGNSNNSIISIPTNGYDDNTIDANTLYEWSVADNAPSIGSAADIFLNDKKVGKEKNSGGYGSSSDEDNDDDDGQDENLQHFKYCKLSDSPPPKNKPAGDEEDTPIRKGKGLSFRSNSYMNARKFSYGTPAHSPEKLKSPNKIKTKIQRVNQSTIHLPVQTLRKADSGPIDVDSFLGNDVDGERSNGKKMAEYDNAHRHSGSSHTSKSKNNTTMDEINNEQMLPAELKGKIHAMNFDEDDNPNSSFESNLSGDASCSLENASVRNLGNNNSPEKLTRPTKVVNDSIFSSTINLGDGNHPKEMIQKKLAEMEPEFTFSINEEDLFGSDVDSVATAWLLNDGDDNALSNGATNKMQWELDTLEADIQRDRKVDISTATDGTGMSGKRFRKKVKDQMKSKFQSMVNKTKSKANTLYTSNECNRSNLNSSRIDKAKLKRNESGLSITPLTGIEHHSRIRMGKGRKNKELAREVRKRKEVERRDIERRQQENQHRLMLEKNTRLRLREAERWKAAGTNESNTTNHAVANFDSMDRLQNKKKLEMWMQGVMDNNNSQHDICQQNNQSINSEEVTRSYLPPTYDEKSTITGSAKTTKIDNTAARKHMYAGNFNFEAEFPDEDSTAQTPEASAPITHDFSCVLCKAEERTHLAVPCMHFSFCGECVSKLEQQGADMRCSVCHEKVTKFSKVFY